jgi:hypothetical protein
MLKAGGQLGFAAQAKDVGGAIRMTKDLQGDRSLESQMYRTVDDAHAAFAQPAKDLVAGDGGRALALWMVFADWLRNRVARWPWREVAGGLTVVQRRQVIQGWHINGRIGSPESGEPRRLTII